MLQRTGKFTITISDLKHKCRGSTHKWRGPTHNSAWLGETLANKVSRNMAVLVKELVNGLKMDYKKSTNYHRMWKAQDLVWDWFQEGHRQSFHLLPSLLSRISEVDPNSVVDWSNHEDTNVFKWVFVCPSTIWSALHYVQTIVCLDICHTKNIIGNSFIGCF